MQIHANLLMRPVWTEPQCGWETAECTISQRTLVVIAFYYGLHLKHNTGVWTFQGSLSSSFLSWRQQKLHYSSPDFETCNLLIPGWQRVNSAMTGPQFGISVFSSHLAIKRSPGCWKSEKLFETECDISIEMSLNKQIVFMQGTCMQDVCQIKYFRFFKVSLPAKSSVFCSCLNANRSARWGSAIKKIVFERTICLLSKIGKRRKKSLAQKNRHPDVHELAVWCLQPRSTERWVLSISPAHLVVVLVALLQGWTIGAVVFLCKTSKQKSFLIWLQNTLSGIQNHFWCDLKIFWVLNSVA